MSSRTEIELFLGGAVLSFWLICESLGGCNVTSVHTAKVLKSAGYAEIEVGDHAWFACADWFATEFSAVGPSGEPTNGAVCCGVFKNCTIRID